ncbi:ABC transporter ATP-binding protein [Hydrogenophaga atypica]|uniref:ABC transporter ATP-binding protein n=1 Tax=Hydrogenophaga atypica TaxID=249409 RepID=A0ABW2QPX0_9BURK
MSAPVLEVAGLHQRFGATEVLRDLNLQVRAGERLAVIGPNGAGKSTLFNAISGLVRPSAGHIRLRGQAITSWSVHKRHQLGLARSFQISQLFGQLTVRDHLRCAASWPDGQGYRFWRMLDHQRTLNARVDAWLERLGLAERAADIAAELSYAEQRTLDIGMALTSEAEVLLLDEPTAGMSRSETARFVPLLRELTEGKTLLMVEHDMGVVFELADRIAVLVQGELLACDTPQAIRANPSVQRAYLGQSQGSDA